MLSAMAGLADIRKSAASRPFDQPQATPARLTRAFNRHLLMAQDTEIQRRHSGVGHGNVVLGGWA
jgi:hypothetical protein